MDEKKIIGGVVVLLIAVGGILYVTSGSAPATSPSPTTTLSTEESNASSAFGPNLALAQCLKDQGVVFYGAFWCAHCKAQKALFGDAVPALPYVECSSPDGNLQTDICKEKKIESYPTWEFKDGTRLSGVQQLADLAVKANCSTGAVPSVESSAK